MQNQRMSWNKKKELCLYKGESYLGKIVNSWKILSYHSTKKKPNGSAVLWLCECTECGNQKPQFPYNIFLGKSKSCFECAMKNHKGENNHNWKGIGKIPKTILSIVKAQARNRNIPIKIDGDYLNALWLKQQEKCALTGLPLIMDARTKNRTPWSNTASLDRIDSSKGYIPGNVQWVHPIINMMKNHFAQDQFIYYCKCVATHNNTDITIL